jgi:hypothetical protein
LAPKLYKAGIFAILVVEKMKLALTLLSFTVLFVQAESSTKCVSAAGIMRCKKDPSKHFNVAVYLMDRDGIGLLQWLDPDDLMA